MSDSLLNNLFHVADEMPDKLAITSEVESITFRSLAAAVQRVGTALRSKSGVQSRAILVLANSIDYVIALFGCWAAGLLVVPIDASSKKREILNVINHAMPDLIISSVKRKDAMYAADIANITFVDIREVRHDATNRVYERCDEADDAMLIFTSGTSGNPKGVVLTHRNLYANTVSIVEYLHLSSADSSVVVLPFHYSYGNSVLQTHLFVGGTVIIGRSMMYPQQVTDQLRQYNPSGFSGVPTTFSLLLSRSDFAVDPPALRYVTQAGSAMDGQLTSRLRESLRENTVLCIMYGQTEATARLTWLPPEYLDKKPGSAGIPIPGTDVRIIGKDGATLAADRVGEIVARGENIMSRYWENEEATASAIVNGWLHTGDLGSIDTDGFLFIQGRASEMIKTGAYRVNPKEVEEVIAEFGFVKEVAVCGVPDELLGQVIVAFIVGQESEEHAREILEYCRRSLSLHKVPKGVIWKSSLPKTSSGKFRKRILVDDWRAKQASRARI